jgi:hypothetical protein
MIKSDLRSLCCVLALMSAGVPLVSGCSNAGQEEAAEKAGSIELGLTASGSNGAVYGFPVGTYLQVTSATVNEWVPLSGAETLLQRTFPVGSYTVTLYFQNGNVELTKTDGTVTTTVEAEWTNSQPVTVDIAEGQTTPLALHFAVKDLTDIVFETGTLQVIADVVEQETDQPANATVNGTTNVYYSNYADSSATYASALAVDEGVDLGISLAFQATGDWAQYGSTSVCQIGTLSQASATGSVGLSRRLEQVVGGTGYLCVYDNGASDQINLYPSRYGAAPAGQEMFLPDAAYSFTAGVVVYGLGDIYDGTTLQQTQLENLSLSTAYFYHQVYDATQELTFIQGTLNATLSLSP